MLRTGIITNLCFVLLIAGCSPQVDMAARSQSVAQPALIADFKVANTEGFKPLEVKFQNTSQGAISKYFWDFGDGTLSTDPSPVHIYNQVGTYTVTLTVTGQDRSNNIIKTNYITVLSPAKQESGIVNWKDAGNCIGRKETVEGTIVTTRYLSASSGKPTFLNFNNPYKGYFTCLIWGSDRDKFIRSFSMDPETYLLNKLVQVTGLIEEYPAGSKIPEMILKDPVQIKIISR